MRQLADLGHDPADRLAAMALAAGVRREALHGRVLPRSRSRAPTYEAVASGAPASRRVALRRPRHEILEMFRAQ